MIAKWSQMIINVSNFTSQSEVWIYYLNVQERRKKHHWRSHHFFMNFSVLAAPKIWFSRNFCHWLYRKLWKWELRRQWRKFRENYDISVSLRWSPLTDLTHRTSNIMYCNASRSLMGVHEHGWARRRPCKVTRPRPWRVWRGLGNASMAATYARHNLLLISYTSGR